MYETLEGIAEQSERIASLEELVLEMWDFFCVVPDEPHVSKEELDFSIEVWRRMRGLGIEVDK
jgi:hypothetical protein